MRKPNYNLERKDRERAKQAKAAAKMEKRAAKGGEDRQAAASAGRDDAHPVEVQGAKPVG